MGTLLCLCRSTRQNVTGVRALTRVTGFTIFIYISIRPSLPGGTMKTKTIPVITFCVGVLCGMGVLAMTGPSLPGNVAHSSLTPALSLSAGDREQVKLTDYLSVKSQTYIKKES